MGYLSLIIIAFFLGVFIGSFRMFYVLDRKQIDGFFIVMKDGTCKIDIQRSFEDANDILKTRYIKLRTVEEGIVYHDETAKSDGESSMEHG